MTVISVQSFFDELTKIGAGFDRFRGLTQATKGAVSAAPAVKPKLNVQDFMKAKKLQGAYKGLGQNPAAVLRPGA